MCIIFIKCSTILFINKIPNYEYLTCVLAMRYFAFDCTTRKLVACLPEFQPVFENHKKRYLIFDKKHTTRMLHPKEMLPRTGIISSSVYLLGIFYFQKMFCVTWDLSNNAA